MKYTAHEVLKQADGLDKYVMPHSPHLNVLVQPLIDEFKQLLQSQQQDKALIRELVTVLYKPRVIWLDEGFLNEPIPNKDYSRMTDKGNALLKSFRDAGFTTIFRLNDKGYFGGFELHLGEAIQKAEAALKDAND